MKLIKRFRPFLFIIYLVFLISGCVTVSPQKFASLELGMTKEQVKQVLGKPYLLRSSIQSKNDSLDETWEYIVAAPSSPNANWYTGYLTYWVMFKNGSLVFYGQPGDYGTTMPERSQQEIYHHIIKEEAKKEQ